MIEVYQDHLLAYEAQNSPLMPTHHFANRQMNIEIEEWQ